MELGSYFLFLQEQIKDIIISTGKGDGVICLVDLDIVSHLLHMSNRHTDSLVATLSIALLNQAQARGWGYLSCSISERVLTPCTCQTKTQIR
jgi:hypothetical protein